MDLADRRMKGRTFCLPKWSRRRLIAPSAFFLAVIYYEELFMKLFCFHSLSVAGVFFTLIYSIPMAILFGLLCGGVGERTGQRLLVVCTGIISLWMGSQIVYYHLFKTFMTIFSLTKMLMVAQSFGNMAVGQVLMNWFPILMMVVPVVLAMAFRKRIVAGPALVRGDRLRWLGVGALVQVAGILLVLLCGGGNLSLRYLYLQAAAPELEVQNFGMFTQTQLEIRRVLFGIDPDNQILPKLAVRTSSPYQFEENGDEPGLHVMDIDFEALIQRDKDDPTLTDMHQYFSKVEPTPENQWTGRFAGKNLIWVVAEGFSTLAMDPVRTPTLWKLSHQGIVCDHFYTPLWGVSTSDGEYVTTTGLIPKSGVWSYSESSDNYMPFGFGTLFNNLGYRTLAYHDYLYDYYDRNLSHPNMGYEYYGIGNGLDMEIDEDNFPPSDQEMMEKIVPQFVNEDHFMVYCLTVSGHLKYDYQSNAMSRRHWNEVSDLGYSEPVTAYLACQMELELAMESLVNQLEAAGKLDDTVIVLSADHYPYGLTDEEYSELLGHQVDPVFEIYKNTLILWSADLEEPVHVDKYCSSLDVMPTLANLFGLEYDSRLIMGRDILSDESGLVIFSNYSFITDKGRYDSTTDTFEMWDGSQPDPDYVAERLSEVQNRVAYSASILDTDYYRVVFGSS